MRQSYMREPKPSVAWVHATKTIRIVFLRVGGSSLIPMSGDPTGAERATFTQQKLSACRLVIVGFAWFVNGPPGFSTGRERTNSEINGGRNLADDQAFNGFSSPLPQPGPRSFHDRRQPDVLAALSHVRSNRQLHSQAGDMVQDFQEGFVSISKLEDAILLAVRSHAGQIDKGGHPYILHPLRVMLACETEEQRITAVLHDTAEDCGVELRLIRHRFGDAVADAVNCLTRYPDEETYESFIQRCAGNEIARAVKIADLLDNMDLTRLNREPEMEDLRRHWKYGAALNVLRAQAIEARRAETDIGSVHESAVTSGDAPNP